MRKRSAAFLCGLLMLLLGAGVATVPVAAALNEIPPGGTVFIGEEDLDISATGVVSGGTIGWWGPGTSLANSEPSFTLRIGTNTSFYVNPQTFRERQGPWYTYPDRVLAFYVQDPYLALRVYDVSTGRDRTEGRVIRGDELMFRIDTNLYVMKERGVAGAPVTIRVRDPVGAEYVSLVNSSGERTSLEEMPVDSPVYYTVPIWDTGRREYSYGTYYIWAECNANRMKENYPVVGKTVTSMEERGVEEVVPPTITVATPSPSPATATVTPTPSPAPSPTPAPTVVTVETAVPETTTVETGTPPPATMAPGFSVLAALAGVVTLVALSLLGRRGDP